MTFPLKKCVTIGVNACVGNENRHFVSFTLIQLSNLAAVFKSQHRIMANFCAMSLYLENIVERYADTNALVMVVVVDKTLTISIKVLSIKA